jgi:methionine synthase II (cobalamin-independent)
MGLAVRQVFDWLPDLPHLPELPARGPWADMIGRALGVLAGVNAQYEAGQWRLAPTSGIDLRRARTTLRDDLDQLEELASDFEGVFKLQITGCWTLAAATMAAHTVRVLADPGARRDVAQALAEGVKELLGQVRSRLPKLDALILQIDEPSLPSVLAGSIPTPGGLFRHDAISAQEVAESLSLLSEAASAEKADTVLHCCAPGLPVKLVVGPAKIDGISLDADLLGGPDSEALAEAAESGKTLWLGCLPTNPEALPSVDELRIRVLNLLDRIGTEVPPDRLFLTPACGLSGYPPAQLPTAFARLRRAAGQVSEELGS